ncbi:hypothetical protein L7F22_062818 [Adiantum nelumboides]|nr:hypothetical protein [Adiantum nelumboides]
MADSPQAHQPLLERKYHEGCPGCALERRKMSMKGPPKMLLALMGYMVLCNTLPLSSLFPFIYFMVRDFGIAKSETRIGTYAGFVAAGVQMDPAKIEAIRNWPDLKNVHEVRSFLGLCSYYRRYVRKFAEIASPLHMLTQKGVPFSWGVSEVTVFQTLKENMTTGSVLILPDLQKSFEVYCDACGRRLGAVLMQEGRVIAYESRMFSKPEMTTQIYEKELLAVIHALTQWRHYLLGADFTLFTDHQSLRYFLSQKQMRWANILSQFHFQIVHVQGQKNVVADALSRKPLVHAISAIHHSTFEDMIDQYATDPDFADIFTRIRDGETVAGYSLREGYLMRKTMLCVTQPLREKVMTKCHCPPYTGHRGVATTMKGVERYFYWPRLKKDVEEFVRSCLVCQKVKFDRHKAQGLLQPLPIPTRPWESIAMDFIFDLLRTQSGHDGASLMFGRFLSATFWGMLADKYGRKPVIIFGTATIVVFNTAFGFSTSFWLALSTRFLLGLLNGMLGPVRAYASEVCTKEYQAFGLAMVGTMWGVGLIIGPAIGGYLAQPSDKYPTLFPSRSFFDRFPYALPCLCISAIAFFGVFVGFWLPIAGDGGAHIADLGDYGSLQESLHKHKNSQIGLQRSEEISVDKARSINNIQGSNHAIITVKGEVPTKKKRAWKNWGMVSAIALYFLWGLHDMAYSEIFSLWAVSPNKYGGLGFTTSDVGTVLAVSGAVLLVFQLLAYAPLANRFGAIRIIRFAAVTTLPLIALYPLIAKTSGVTLWSTIIPANVIKNILSCEFLPRFDSGPLNKTYLGFCCFVLSCGISIGIVCIHQSFIRPAPDY